jgi:hypothetical protein
VYEFEDLIQRFDRADLFCPTRYHGDLRWDLARNAQRLLALTGRRARALRSYVPHPVEFRPDHDYDLLFAIFDNPFDLALVNAVQRFRTRCARVVCYIIEVWPRTFDSRRFHLENFADYHHIFVGTYSDVGRFAEVSGVPCSFFPAAVDNTVFSPWYRHLRRVVDVVNFGRRTPRTHEALLALARDKQMFYLYDDIRNGEFDDPVAHRTLLAQILLRSRYSIANFARADSPQLTRGARELGFRFVEGAAAGVVLLGAPPDRHQLDEQMPWLDAVIPIPLDSSEVADTIADLDRDPGRVESIRRRNIAGSLRRHDWVYRWELVLETLGLPVTDVMVARRQCLEEEATRWDP